MRTITVREFRKDLHQQLKDLPVVVTRRENTQPGQPVRPVCIVMSYREDLLIPQESSDIPITKEVKEEKKGLFSFLRKDR